jgi:flagellar biosynthetic protein FlhB
MPEQFTQDRNEAPTPRRRDEAREKGRVALSADIGQASLLLAGLGLLWLYAGTFAATVQHILRQDLSRLFHEEWTIQHTVILCRSLLGYVFQVLSPWLAILVAIAVGVNAAQVGLRVSFTPLAPNWERVSLTGNWSRLFSLRAMMRGVMLLLKLSLGLSCAGWFLYRGRDHVLSLGHQSLLGSIAGTWRLSLLLGCVLGGMLLLIGAVDLLFQRWQHEQDLKMTRQEVRDEQKRDEGDPHVKTRMKRLAREAIKQRMLRRVSEATVILTNPTHIAVALKYERHAMGAPRVIAKGTDLLARRITKLAREHGIPVLERKPLARALYASVDIDQEIPPNLYRAVAEILAYVYGLRRAA